MSAPCGTRWGLRALASEGSPLLDTGRTPYNVLANPPRQISAADLAGAREFVSELSRAYRHGLGKYDRTFLEPSQATKIGTRIHQELERLVRKRSEP